MEQFIERKLSGKLRSKQVVLLLKKMMPLKSRSKKSHSNRRLHSEICVGRTNRRVASERQEQASEPWCCREVLNCAVCAISAASLLAPGWRFSTAPSPVLITTEEMQQLSATIFFYQNDPFCILEPRGLTEVALNIAELRVAQSNQYHTELLKASASSWCCLSMSSPATVAAFLNLCTMDSVMQERRNPISFS